MAPPPRVWFITGASSGFGRCMTELVLQRGEIVVATLRKPEALNDLKARYPADRLLILKLDVSKPEEITAAFSKAHKAYGKIDVVFNNAGYTVLGEVESVSDEVARADFEVNFWGAVHVTQNAIKTFREVNKPSGGRLLTSGSYLAVQGLPALGFYCATKHALKAITEAAAAELDPEWDIKITMIELGGYRTKAGSESLVRVPQHSAYSKPTLVPSIIRATLGTKKGREGPQDPVKASAKIYDLSLLPNPPLHLPLGKDAFTAMKSTLTNLAASIEPYESWSEDLQWDRDD